VVVSDSRVSPLLAAKMLDIPDICILNQFQIIIPRRSRLLRLAKLVDTGALAMIGKLWTSGATHLMIPDFPPPYVLSAGNLRIPKAYQRRVKLIGPILPVRPDDLPSKEELRSSLGLNVDSQMIYLPISGPVKERAYVTGLLRQIVLDLPESYQVVMSLGYPNNSIKPVHKGNVSIYGWVPNRFEYLKACDLVVSRAGHGTLVQSICYGKPMVLIPTPSHTEQVNNALRAKELGLAEVLDQEDVSRDTVVKVIDRMLSDESCRKRAEEVQKDISGLNGLETAVDTILQVAQNN
jgi:UDP-N-acetylglucosamine--N-acetylmuramyl-(pentapeptide) pyrophosphoryl-undecaprenol N-acetylglucosamine transferase